MHNAQVVRGIK